MVRDVRVVGLLLALTLGGCGQSMATISGKVTVDGAPLEKGTIAYVPAEGTGAPATVEVVNGAYQAQMTPGKKLIQISAPKVIGKRKEYNGPNAPEVEISEESLPEKYNSKSELTFDAKGGANTKDWQVESKNAKP
jgi:hypothetical protein